MDEGCDFADFFDLGWIRVVILLISVIWDRFGWHFADFFDLGWIRVLILLISEIWWMVIFFMT